MKVSAFLQQEPELTNTPANKQTIKQTNGNTGTKRKNERCAFRDRQRCLVFTACLVAMAEGSVFIAKKWARSPIQVRAARNRAQVQGVARPFLGNEP